MCPMSLPRTNSIRPMGRLLAVGPLLVMLFSSPALSSGNDEGALPDHLSWKSAIEIFRRQGFDLLLADAAVERAKGDALMAGATANPAISAGAGRSFAYGNCKGCTALGWSFGLSDQSAMFDIVSGKRGLRQAAARLAVDMSRQDRADAQRTLESAVSQAYVSVVYAQQELAAQREAQETLGKLTELNRARYQHGSISEVEVMKVETEKLGVDQDVDRAEQALASAKSQLAYLLGVRTENTTFEVDAELPAYRVPPLLSDGDVSKLLREAWQHRPDLRGARIAREKAEAEIRSSRRLRFPDIALSAGVDGQGAGTNAVTPPTVSIGLTLTPPLFNRFNGEIAKAEADSMAARAQEGKIQAQVLSDVLSAYAQWSHSRRRVERAQEGLLDRARKTRDLVGLQYQKGAASLLEFLDAERILITTRLDYINDLADYWQAVVLIGQAVGVELEP
jgi:outer membrane protein, heavy metal efflux system